MPTTLRQGIAEQIPVEAYCFAMGCNHHSPLDLVALAERFGLDHGAMHWDLVPKMRCTKCGSTQAGIRSGYSMRHRGVHRG